MIVANTAQLESVMVVGAHAFDAEVIAGPLVASVTSAGGRGMMVHLSLGEQGHEKLGPAEYAEQKRREAAGAAAHLGAEQITFDLADAFIPSDDDTALRLADLIRAWKPQVIVTHWGGTWHKDHSAAHTLTSNAVFYAALPTLSRAQPVYSPQQVLFGENWEDDEEFRPDTMFDVTAGMDAWRTGIREYELGRELSAFPYFDYYLSLYRLRGCLAGTRYAQAFTAMPIQRLTGMQQFLSPRPAELGGAP